ncbi:ATP-binding cassette domain-containing protein [Actinoplanes sp. NPDC026619]|uniref:ATP-binding cassette domain-containing protein n=1 Tax=Actinoplanes sp. NPDC026619 TaxID=3155798 RepID=UPI0033FD2E03
MAGWLDDAGVDYSRDPADLAVARLDRSGWPPAGRPSAVVRPADAAGVRRVLRLADEAGTPVVPRGAGTGLSGGATAGDGTVVLDLTRLNRITSLSPDDGTAVVEPGVITADLDAAAGEHGLTYAPDPASVAISTIGGNIATNAGGLRCAKYGVTRDSVLGLQVVLAGGRQISTGTATFKGVTGYDLTRLFVGSEGTLGVIVEATVRLRPLPLGTATIAAAFPDIEAAAAACSALSRARVQPAIAELLDAGVPDPELRARQYPHELSGGLRQRALIAIALAGKPKLIIADEPTSALDVTVQKRILDHLGGLVREQGISLLIITHDLAVAADRADRIVVMQNGRLVEEGSPSALLHTPRSPYTRQLISATPRLAPRFDVRDQIAPEPILTLTDVSKTFAASDLRRGARGFNALDKVSVTVPRGQTHALVGESGCGKTTTLRIALGLENATSGSVVLDGDEISGLSWNKLRPLRRKAQLVHQDPFATLDPKFTIAQSITEPLVSFRIGNRKSRLERAKELLDQVALPSSYLDRLPSELSGGQRQRVAIARALALRPDLIMLDEPVSALDVLVQEQILQLLADLQAALGLSYLFVSHDLAVVAAISHTVSVMSHGKVVEQGPVAEVFTNPQSSYTRELIDAIPGRRVVDAA